jgi:two-component system, OmpR family, phosphate regulon response regulator PhoB
MTYTRLPAGGAEMAEEKTHRHRVLVIEDEDNIAVALDYVLMREGYDHDRIATGGEAMQRIRQTHPDLVLLDVMLPDVSGYEICQDVRLDPTLSDVKILMMTARGSAIERRKGLALGADGFISKPFELADLRLEVRRLLGLGG